MHLGKAEFARDILDGGKYCNHDVTVTVTDNAHMTVLNARYALLRTPTDVLSFRLADVRKRRGRRRGASSFAEEVERLRGAPYLDPESGRIVCPERQDSGVEIPLIPQDLGHIFLSAEYCHRVAAERGMKRHDYMLLATVHGLAHLTGHVHKTPQSYDAMRKAEAEVVAALSEEFHLKIASGGKGSRHLPDGCAMPASYLL